MALELTPNDVNLLYSKALVHTRLRNNKESIVTLLRILEIDKHNQSAIFDLTEVYLMIKQEKELTEMLSKHSTLFKDKHNGKLLELFMIVVNYQNKKIDELKELSLSNIDLTDLTTKRKLIEGWQLKDLLIYLSVEPATAEKTIVQSLFWYLDGQLTATDFFI